MNDVGCLFLLLLFVIVVIPNIWTFVGIVAFFVLLKMLFA